MTTPASHRASRSASQRGLSLVELMVGAAISLFIAAAGAALLANNLRENRALMLEARLTQDLRTAADLVSRDLRRAGYWGRATEGVWTAGATRVAANPYAALAPAAAASDAISFRYSRDATVMQNVDANEEFGFRLHRGAIEMQLGAGNWQALTDIGTLSVTTFSLAPSVQDISLESFCARPCAAGSAAACPPHQAVRTFGLVITGQLTNDPRLSRSVHSQVRLRNDAVVGACAE